MANGGTDPVTRDGLRAELAALELRLIEKFASNERVRLVEERVVTAEAIKGLIGTALQDAEARGWTSRERAMGVGLLLIALATLALNLVATLT